jgi:hypothetical protein
MLVLVLISSSCASASASGSWTCGRRHQLPALLMLRCDGVQLQRRSPVA